MSTPYLLAHPLREDFDPHGCLDLPEKVGQHSQHALRTRLPDGTERPVYLLTPTGRSIFAAHLAGAEPWVQYPKDLETFFLDHRKTSPPALTSWTFHLVNLLARYPTFAFRRSDLGLMKESMFQAFQSSPHPGLFPNYDEDGDVIQHVNKTDQFGLARQSGRMTKPGGRRVTYYWLRTPYEFDRRVREPRPETAAIQPVLPDCEACQVPSSPPTPLDRDLVSARNEVIDYLYRTWIDVPVSNWSYNGHRDPSNKTSHELVAQPQEYNRHSKDKWKFDRYGMKECPSVDYLLSHFDAFYPSDDEKLAIFNHLSRLLDDETGSHQG